MPPAHPRAGGNQVGHDRVDPVMCTLLANRLPTLLESPWNLVVSAG